MENENTIETVDTARLDELKQEATELGITFSPRISAESLSKRIEEHYAAASKTTDKPVVKAAGKDEASDPGYYMRVYAREAEAKARKTRVVTIIDNDQRVNNVTTTCVANCSNDYFDLGTMFLPLNEKVEVRQGHIDALLSVFIPHHQRSRHDPNMSETVMRPRYTIQYEDLA